MEKQPEHRMIKMMRRRRRKLLIFSVLVTCYLFYRLFPFKEGGTDQSLLSGTLVKCVNNEMLNISSPKIITKEIFAGFETCEKQCSLVENQERSPPEVELDDVSLELCKLQELGKQQFTVECEEHQSCKHNSWYSLGISSSNKSDFLEWESFTHLKSLSQYLKSLLNKSSNKYHSGFVVLKCDIDDSRQATQILSLPPRPVTRTSGSHVSVNIVLVTNMTRAQVYAQCPDTISSLTHLNTMPGTRLEVLDFSSVQDLGQQRNLAALVTGMTEFSNVSSSLTRNFSAAGHQVTWQSSQCWNSSLVRTLASPHVSSYADHIAWLETNGVSGTGVTNVQCHVSLSERDKVSTLLSSSQLQAQTMSSQHSSYLSITVLPPLDNTTESLLSSYIDNVSSLHNTVTILSSVSSQDSSQSLPLFIIIPNRVKTLWSDSGWENFVVNQQSLVSMIDVHYTLSSLVRVSPHVPHSSGLMSRVQSRICSDVPRSQFACVCQPSLTNMDSSMKEAVAEVLTELHNTVLASNTDTVCARLRLEAVLYGEVATYGPDDLFLRLKVVFVVVPTDESDEGVKESQNILSGSIELHMETRKLEMMAQQHDPSQSKLRYGCLQQYSSLEEVRLEVSTIIGRERDRSGVSVASVFTENSVDCVWVVTREYSAAKMVSILLVSSCDNSLEAVVRVETNQDSLMWRQGDQKVMMESGEVKLVNLIMSPLQSVKTPVWSYKVLDIRYLDPEDEN